MKESEQPPKENIKNIPAKIYLQIDADGETPKDFKELGGVSWADERIHSNDIEYVHVSEEPAHRVDKLPIGWAESIVKAKEFFGETRWSLMGSKMQSDIIEWGFFVDTNRGFPSPERGESDEEIWKDAQEQVHEFIIREQMAGRATGRTAEFNFLQRHFTIQRKTT